MKEGDVGGNEFFILYDNELQSLVFYEDRSSAGLFSHSSVTTPNSNF